MQRRSSLESQMSNGPMHSALLGILGRSLDAPMSARTRAPRRTSASTTTGPRNPPAPVTTTGTASSAGGTPLPPSAQGHSPAAMVLYNLAEAPLDLPRGNIRRETLAVM